MTTNGVLLAEQAAALRAAGLHRVTVSLDTLRRGALHGAHPPRHARPGARGHRGGGPGRLARAQARHRGHARRQRRRAGGPDRVRRRRVAAEVRFIEYMDVGGATHWRMERVVVAPRDAGAPRRALRADRADRRRRRPRPPTASGCPTARVFGIISSTTAPFCRACDRSRLTADGLWYLCLYAQPGHRPARAAARRAPRARSCRR